MANLTGLTATLVSNFVQTKEGKGKGKTFYVYEISGSPDALKKYTNSKQFKEYPRHSATGTPQFITQYFDLLRDVVPMYLSYDKTRYTLDQSETRMDLARMEGLDKQSPTLAKLVGERITDKIFGTSKVTSSVANGFKPEQVTSDGKDADLNGLES